MSQSGPSAGAERSSPPQRSKATWLILGALVVGLVAAAVATRATATSSAQAMQSEDRELMDASRLGPPPRESPFYRLVDTATGELRTADGTRTLGVVESWSSVLALVPDGGTLWGFALGEPAPPNDPKAEDRTDEYKNWLKAQRLELFVGDGPGDRSDDELTIRWRGRDLPAKVFDVDPVSGLSYYVVQLDDGVKQDDERSERAPKISPGRLELAPDLETPVVVRGLAEAAPDQRGFVTARATRSAEGDRDLLRGLSGPLSIGSPIAFLPSDGSGPAVIGMVSTPAPPQALARLTPSDVINAFGEKVAAAVADRPRPNAVLGVATHTDPASGGRAVVDSVEGGSAAEHAGLVGGDVIERIDETPIGSRSALLAALAQRRPGDRVAVTVRRGIDAHTVEVELGARS